MLGWNVGAFFSIQDPILREVKFEPKLLCGLLIYFLLFRPSFREKSTFHFDAAAAVRLISNIYVFEQLFQPL
jgi:hypothetical protein